MATPNYRHLTFLGLVEVAGQNGDGSRWSISRLQSLPQCLNTDVRTHIQFGSVAQLSPALCDCVDCSTPGLPAHHQLLEPTQTHVHRVGDAIQPSHPLSPPSPPAFNLSRHQGLFRGVSSSHQVTRVLEFQFHHQSFQ